jgi:tetratricopeptide (TPR) repeat protein
MFYSINKYLYDNDNFPLIRILSKIIFFNKTLKFRLAWIYYADSKYHNAIETLENCFDNESYYLLANSYEQIEDYSMAIEIYTKIINNDINERPDILYNRGAMYKNIGKYGEAIEDFKNCINCKEPDPKAFIAMGVIMDELGEYEEAREYFQKGNSLNGFYKEYIPEKYK